MAETFITSQLAPLIANAGVTQTVTISSPTTLSLGGLDSNGNVPPGTVGVSTASGGVGSGATIFGVTWSQFAVYIFIAALAYFGLRWMGKG